MSEFTKILKVSPLGDGDNWILLEEFKYYDTKVMGKENEPYWITVPPKFQKEQTYESYAASSDSFLHSLNGTVMQPD